MMRKSRAAAGVATTGGARLWTPMFVIVVAATLASFMVGQGSNSGTSVYLVRIGGTTSAVGLLAVVFSVAAAVTRLVGGPLIDRRGRQVVIVAGALVMLVGTLGPMAASELAPFILWRFLQGVGFSAATTALATAAADVLPEERLGEGIGYYGLGQAISMSIGPALAIALANSEPPENLFVGLSCCAAATLGLGLLIRYERNPLGLPPTSEYRRGWEERQAEGEASAAGEGSSLPQQDGPAWRRWLRAAFEARALPGTIPMMAISPAFGFGIFFVGLYGTTLGVGNPGAFYTVSAVMMVAVRLGAGRFMDSVAPIRLFAVAVAGGLAAYVLLLAAPGASGASDALFYAAGLPYGLSLGLALPVNQAVAVKGSPASRWGAANALFLFASDVGIGFSCLAWGLVNDAFGFPVTMGCVMGCILLSFGLAKACYPSGERAERDQRL